jgi:CheY-like chemotaxis protein
MTGFCARPLAAGARPCRAPARHNARLGTTARERPRPRRAALGRVARSKRPVDKARVHGQAAGAFGRSPVIGVRPRVLVCDPDSRSLRALRLALRVAGSAVDAATTAREAFDRAALCAPEAAIIELVLPDGDGVDVCRGLREWSAMPLIVLSANGDVEQKVRALRAGADDYVTKPFGSAELIARLHAALRRANRVEGQTTLTLHDLEIDLARGAGGSPRWTRDPPHADRTAARPATSSRPFTHPSRTPPAGLGSCVFNGSIDPADPHR